MEHLAIGFYLSGHPLDDYLGPLKRKKVKTLAEVEAKARSGAFVAKLAGTVSGKQERKSARGNRFAFVQCSDPTGFFECTVFSDTLEKFRDFLVLGQNVVLTVEATMEADQLKLLCRSVQLVDTAVADAASMGLKIYIAEEPAIGAVATRLDEANKSVNARQRGPVHLILMHPDLPGEVEVALKHDYVLTPQIAGALKHVPGVQMVEEF
jgi:DNA polymerase-3 subunit alpha